MKIPTILLTALFFGYGAHALDYRELPAMTGNFSTLHEEAQPLFAMEQSTPLLNGLVQKRQACPGGFDICLNRCMPKGSACCSGKLWMFMSCQCLMLTVNADSRYCAAGKKCCVGGACAPVDGEYCSVPGISCERGNHCYTSNETPSGVQCCTDSACTARVQDGTTTTYAPRVQTTYFSFTYTWRYYMYYRTIYEQTTFVISTLHTTITTLSVLATNSAQASSLAEVSIASITATPPADANTQLMNYSRNTASVALETSIKTSATETISPSSSTSPGPSGTIALSSSTPPLYPTNGTGGVTSMSSGHAAGTQYPTAMYTGAGADSSNPSWRAFIGLCGLWLVCLVWLSPM